MICIQSETEIYHPINLFVKGMEALTLNLLNFLIGIIHLPYLELSIIILRGESKLKRSKCI